MQCGMAFRSCGRRGRISVTRLDAREADRMAKALAMQLNAMWCENICSMSYGLKETQDRDFEDKEPVMKFIRS